MSSVSHQSIDVSSIPEVEIKNDAGNPVPVTGTVVSTPSGTQDVNIVSTITLPVSATDLDIRDLNSATDSVEANQATHDDLNANANLQVNNTDVSALNPVPVTGIITPTSTDTAVVTRVAVSTTVATLAADNPDRLQLVVHNENGVLFVKLGTNATDTDYSFRLTVNSLLTIEEYTGEVTAIKATGSTFAQVTELSI